MPPELTAEEKKALFEEAKKFADAAREAEKNLPEDLKLPHLPYATDEEIMRNLENPEMVANYRRAQKLQEDFEKREQYSKSKADVRRDNTGRLYEHAPYAVSQLERSITPQFRPVNNDKDKEYNDALYALFCDSDRANLQYEKYLRDGLAEDFSDLPEALGSTSAALDFYEKHSPHITGFYSGEHLISKHRIPEDVYDHYHRYFAFTTDLWGFYHTMKHTASYAYFALPNIPRLPLETIGVYKTLTFNRTGDPYSDLMANVQGVSTLKNIDDCVKGYQSLGGEITAGFFRDHELVDKDGNVVAPGDKPFSELTLRMVSPEKHEALDKIFNEREFEEQVRRRVRVARAPENERNAVENDFVDPYDRNERLLHTKKDELQNAVDAYRNLNWFRRLFAFSARRDIADRTSDLKALGATALEVKLILSGNKLSRKEYDLEVSRLTAAAKNPNVHERNTSHADYAEFRADAHFLSGVRVPGLSADELYRKADRLLELAAEQKVKGGEGAEEEFVLVGLDEPAKEPAREPLDVPASEIEPEKAQVSAEPDPLAEPEKQGPAAENVPVLQNNAK